MAGKVAATDVVINGTSLAVKNLEDLETKWRDLAKTTQAYSIRLKAVQEEWAKPSTMTMAFAKAGAQILGQQVTSLASAIAAPAQTTYAQAISAANAYRDSTQRIATSTGKSFSEVTQQIKWQSSALGISTSQVSNFGRGVKSLTGDWNSAIGSIDAFQNHALKTGQSLEDMIPVAADLAQNFGIKSSANVNQFFGTLDAQAKAAGVSIEVAQRSFTMFGDTLSTITATDPGKVTALMMAFQKGAPNAQAGNRTFGAFMGIVQQYRYQIESDMRAAGKLGKGEHLFNSKTGQWDADKLAGAATFIPQILRKAYGKDVVEKTGRIVTGGDYVVAAGLNNLKEADVRSAMSARAKEGDSGFLFTDAGKRQAAEANKERKDVALGANFLSTQDAAVAAGGGAAGVAIASAGAAFSKATDAFSRSVDIFARAASKGGSAGGGAVSTAAGAAAAAGAFAKKYLPGALVAYVAGEAAVAGAEAAADDSTRKTAKNMRKAVRSIPVLGSLVVGDDDSDLALKSKPNTSDAAPRTSLTAKDIANEIGAAVAKHMEGKTLRTQNIAPPVAPAGQEQPR